MGVPAEEYYSIITLKRPNCFFKLARTYTEKLRAIMFGE